MADKKPAPQQEAKPEPKAKDESAHDRIDRLEALMRANGWSVDD